MKTIAKVFIIIGMIAGAIAILPLIFGIIGLKKLNAAKSAEDMPMLWKILILLFVSPVASIILFLMKDEDYAK